MCRFSVRTRVAFMEVAARGKRRIGLEAEFVRSRIGKGTHKLWLIMDNANGQI